MRRQRTDELAALRAVQRTENQALRFRGQRFEKTDELAALCAGGWTGNRALGFSSLLGREAPKSICLLSSQIAVL
ncbi:MAG: hypothetical protein LBD06_01230 [Candidatus Accumulibacter sp.]|nr:hypothetical protein [Accumulibacter sp.]